MTTADPNDGLGGCCLIQILLAVLIVPPVIIALNLPHQTILWYTFAGVTGLAMLRRAFGPNAIQSANGCLASIVVAFGHTAIIAYMVFIAYGFDSIGRNSGVWVGTPPLAAALGFVLFAIFDEIVFARPDSE